MFNLNNHSSDQVFTVFTTACCTKVSARLVRIKQFVVSEMINDNRTTDNKTCQSTYQAETTLIPNYCQT